MLWNQLNKETREHHIACVELFYRLHCLAPSANICEDIICHALLDHDKVGSVLTEAPSSLETEFSSASQTISGPFHPNSSLPWSLCLSGVQQTPCLLHCDSPGLIHHETIAKSNPQKQAVSVSAGAFFVLAQLM